MIYTVTVWCPPHANIGGLDGFISDAIIGVREPKGSGSRCQFQNLIFDLSFDDWMDLMSNKFRLNVDRLSGQTKALALNQAFPSAWNPGKKCLMSEGWLLPNPEEFHNNIIPE